MLLTGPAGYNFPYLGFSDLIQFLEFDIYIPYFIKQLSFNKKIELA